MDENPKFLQAAARRFFGFSIFDGTSAKPVLMVGYPFAVKNKGVSKGENPLGAGFPIGARSTLLAGKSKGDSVPLAGDIQWRAAPYAAGSIQ